VKRPERETTVEGDGRGFFMSDADRSFARVGAMSRGKNFWMEQDGGPRRDLKPLQTTMRWD
jgi:hypothetical protein